MKEKRRLAEEFTSMKIEIGDHSRGFNSRVDNAAHELRRLSKTVDEEDMVVVILNRVSSEYIQRCACWNAEATSSAREARF